MSYNKGQTLNGMRNAAFLFLLLILSEAVIVSQRINIANVVYVRLGEKWTV